MMLIMRNALQALLNLSFPKTDGIETNCKNNQTTAAVFGPGPVPDADQPTNRAKHFLPVKGRVLKDDGQPVQGASVILKGTNAGTTTDADGNFSISAANGSVIVISSVGFLTQEITVSGSDLKVQLASDSKSMGEVIVVGYGSQRKRDVTGAVTTVTGATLREVPSPNLLNQLKGRAAGVTIISNGATPGSQGQIRIRGNRS